MASGPITLWQIKKKNMEVVTDFLFFVSKITVDSDYSYEIRRQSLLGRKAMTSRQCVEKQRHYSTNRGPYSWGYGLPVVTYDCESWTLKKAENQRIDAFGLWCWRRLRRVPWTTKRSNQSILMEINPEYSSEGLMLKLKLQYFGHLITADSLEKSPMPWTCTWANFGRWWRTGKPGVLHSMGLQRVSHDWATKQQQHLIFRR